MEFDWPGEKLLLKLWDTIGPKGIGALLKPWQMRREGTAAAEIKRLNSLMLAQTKIEVSAIQAGKKVLLPGGKLEDVGTGPVTETEPVAHLAIIAEMEELVRENIRHEALRREVSVAKAILYAEQEFEQDNDKATDVPISDDWLLRWRDNASSISSDELQALWGKVLAGEVKSPGAFSLRTLEFLRNLSREDASLIERAAPLVLKGMIVRPDTSSVLVGDLEFSHLLELQDLGILSGVEGSGVTNHVISTSKTHFENALTCHGRVLFITHDDPTRVLLLPAYIVTKLGKEVIKLGWKKADEPYLLSVATRIKMMGYEVKIGDYSNLKGNLINCYNLVTV
jgi:hypothetical protein